MIQEKSARLEQKKRTSYHHIPNGLITEQLCQTQCVIHFPTSGQ